MIDNYEVVKQFILEEGIEKSDVSSEMALASLEELKKELETTDKLLEESNTVLKAIPECPVHGDRCIPHAIEWVNRVRYFAKLIMEGL